VSSASLLAIESVLTEADTTYNELVSIESKMEAARTL